MGAEEIIPSAIKPKPLSCFLKLSNCRTESLCDGGIRALTMILLVLSWSEIVAGQHTFVFKAPIDQQQLSLFHIVTSEFHCPLM
jgi:hypothetical protein